MQPNYVQRLRLTFRKEGPARYISHLDLARTLERALNRAKVPVAYSQGFNTRPKMSMASALPRGYTSSHELADVWLTETMESFVGWLPDWLDWLTWLVWPLVGVSLALATAVNR